jgi:hypothetical protein
MVKFLWLEQAREDFLQRVRAYEKVYETIQDDEDAGRIRFEVY